MTVEEKAEELAFAENGTFLPRSEAIRRCCIEMAKWKDQQFKEYLEKKKAECNGTSCSAWEVYDEIINEFFKED